MKMFLGLCLMSLFLVGCAANGHAKICVLEAGVNGEIHEWRETGATFDCDDADSPCRSSVTVGFVTVGSDITLGGESNGLGVGVDFTWNEFMDH